MQVITGKLVTAANTNYVTIGHSNTGIIAPTVAVSQEEIDELRDDSKMLYALLDAGVEDWDGFAEAMAIYRENRAN